MCTLKYRKDILQTSKNINALNLLSINRRNRNSFSFAKIKIFVLWRVTLWNLWIKIEYLTRQFTLEVFEKGEKCVKCLWTPICVVSQWKNFCPVNLCFTKVLDLLGKTMHFSRWFGIQKRIFQLLLYIFIDSVHPASFCGYTKLIGSTHRYCIVRLKEN
jgi:hypothetical protein